METLQSYIQNKKYINLFDYGLLTTNVISEIFDDDLPLKMKAHLKSHFPFFTNGVISIKERESTKTNGYFIKITPEEVMSIYNNLKSINYEYIQIKFHDQHANRYQGITFVNNDTRWVNHPTILNVKSIYNIIQPIWKSMDKGKSMYIYDENYTQRASFNGDVYIDLDKRDTLLDQEYSLSYPNPFEDKMKKEDPSLFVTETGKQYFDYSRKCLWSERRQPVVITQDEKDRIDNIAPNSYDDAVMYSSDMKNKKLWYICPRYWDIKNQIPLKKIREEDKDKLINPKASQTDLNEKYIFEFRKPSMKPEDYKTLRPGFLDKSVHPKGIHVPCCFKTIGKKQLKIREEIQNYENEETRSENSDSELDRVIYIKNAEKFPLEYKRIGHLPLTLEKYLNFDNRSCYNELQTKKLKQNYQCLLRYGAKQHDNKSFLSAISLIFLDKVNSYKDIISVIEKRINLDIFIQLHHGSLVQTFFDKTKESDINVHKNTKIFKKLLKSNLELLEKYSNSYMNFMNFIKDENEITDYQYLWEIVSSGILRNEKLNKPINLIILHDPMNDNRNNLQLICPTDTYSSVKFKKTNDSIILYKKRDTYEPLVSMIETKKKRTINKLFSYSKLPLYLKDIIHDIIINTKSKCKPYQNNKVYKYKFSRGVHYEDIINNYIDKLNENSMTIKKQVLHYDGRVVGLIIYDGILKKNMFLPVLSSSLDSSKEFVHIDDTLWSTYELTKDFLNKVHEITDIPCRPVFKVIESNMIVGMITDSNQFVPLINPEPYDNEDDIPVLNDTNHIDVDREIFDKNSEIKNQISYRIHMERKFFNAYMSTLKTALNDSIHIDDKKEIIKQIKSDNDFFTKFNNIHKIISDIHNIYVKFVKFDNSVLNKLNEINSCLGTDNPNKNYCLIDDNGNRILIPDKNLYTDENNNVKYSEKLTEKLIRNTFIFSDIFESKLQIPYDSTKFSINPDELMVLETILQRKYLDSSRKLKASTKYAKHSVYEYADPQDVLDYADYDFYDYLLDEKEPEQPQEQNSPSPEKEPEQPKEQNSPSPEKEQEQPQSPNSPSPEKEPEQPQEQNSPSPEKDQEQPQSPNSSSPEKEQSIQQPLPANVNIIPRNQENKLRLNTNIENLSRSGIYSLEVDPRKKSMVIKLPEKTDKLKLKFKIPENNQAEEQNTNDVENTDLQERRFKKSVLQQDSCIEVKYPPPMWRKKYFPKGTSSIVFKKKVIDCNYKMLAFILKDFDYQRFGRISKVGIQQELSNIYKKIYRKYSPQIRNKWLRQRKGRFLKMTAPIEDIVMDSNYFISETDVVLIAYAYNIPLVLCLQSKGDIKLIHLRERIPSNYLYFMRYTVRNRFDLHILKQNLKFDKNIIPEALMQIINEKTMDSLDIYLKTQLKEFKG